jgi:predicted phosphodiesterase
VKVIVVSDLHGNTVWESIDPDKYDLIVFLGDYVDSWTRSNEQIYNNLLNVINFKKKYSDKVVLLWGNHDLAYVYLGNNKFSCSGHRPKVRWLNDSRR